MSPILAPTVCGVYVCVCVVCVIVCAVKCSMCNENANIRGGKIDFTLQCAGKVRALCVHDI